MGPHSQAEMIKAPDATRLMAAAQPEPRAPIGLTAEGLPVGLQIIGPEGEDPRTIEFARLLAAEIGGFVPPPAHT
jgi:Asp-tRNA(Asn)/Glu-tRNA(Gln) amidotransferase A subunit family amidase